MDKIDIEILRVLQIDARTDFKRIAEHCGVSLDTISKRFRKMKKMGIVLKTTILFNPKNLGYGCIASLGIDVDYPHWDKVVKFIQKIPDVIFCTRSMGKYDIFCIAVLKDVARLAEVKDLIKGHPSVKSASTDIWTDQILLCPQNFEFEHLEEE